MKTILALALILMMGVDGLSQPASLNAEYNQLHDANKHQQSSKYSNPIGRRFIVALFCCVVGFAMSILGWSCWDKNWRVTGSAFIGGGIILASVGLLLFYLSGFRWSWEWWL